MPLRYEDEHYVRVYTRDVNDWLALSFDAQSLLMHLFRKVDRAGVLVLGRHGKRGVAIAIHHRDIWERLEPALEELLADGVVIIVEDRLVIPHFIDAQTTPKSDKARQRECRERARDAALLHVTPASPASHGPTKRDDPSRNVTDGHDDVEGCHAAVTVGHSVQCSAVHDHEPRSKKERESASPPPAEAGPLFAPPSEKSAQKPDPDPEQRGEDLGKAESAKVRKVVDKHLVDAKVILAELSAARVRLGIGRGVIKPRYASLAGIAGQLDAGRSLDDCRHVLAAIESEIRGGNTEGRKYFDSVSPWRPTNFQRYLERPISTERLPTDVMDTASRERLEGIF